MCWHHSHSYGLKNYAKVWLDKFHFTRGEDIVTHYTGGFGFPKDNMNIAPLGQTITGIPGHYSTTWCYFDNPGAKEGTATIPGGNMGNALTVTIGLYI